MSNECGLIILTSSINEKSGLVDRSSERAKEICMYMVLQCQYEIFKTF